MAPGKKASKHGGGKARDMEPSAPEVKVRYASAGRETMAAIEDELTAPSLDTAEAPLIEVSEAPAGRETIAAIAEELADAVRPRQNTLPYGDRISNAPGAPTPSGKLSAAPSSSATPSPTPTRSAASTSSRASKPASSVVQTAPDALEIFELLTFIVRGGHVEDLSTDALRRRFVAEHLLHRVPGESLERVERIEVTPWTAKGTMVVRVWCRA